MLAYVKILISPEEVVRHISGHGVLLTEEAVDSIFVEKDIAGLKGLV